MPGGSVSVARAHHAFSSDRNRLWAKRNFSLGELIRLVSDESDEANIRCSRAEKGTQTDAIA
jgi:hypothetical protein